MRLASDSDAGRIRHGQRDELPGDSHQLLRVALLPQRGELIEALQRLFALDHLIGEFHRWGIRLFSLRRLIGIVF